MQLIDNLEQANLDRDTVLTIGSFDGVHRGHQHLIGQVLRRARQNRLLAGVITFYPHPVAVLAPQKAPPYLTTPGEKTALLKRLGLDVMAIVPFDHHLAQTPARDFLAVLKQKLRLRELWVGPDFALGKNRQGTAPVLQAIGGEMGFSVTAVELLTREGAAISSTRIRQHLAAGQVRQAAALLGRYPSLSGEVIVGARRGRQLGIPTANLAVRPERAVPANGVYAVYAVLGQERHPGVANVGVRPSFDNGERTVETHILDLDEDLYGVDLVVEFVERLRDEQRFDSIDRLIAQIGRDIEQARRVLAGYPSPE
ncbi:MAG: bifunctional riboflavin kinase/FAD synthetase [Chloroflexota bacterium]